MSEHPLVERRKAIYDWANGDPLILSARCAKAEERLEQLQAELEARPPAAEQEPRCR